VVKVNSGATGVEFGTYISTFLSLTDAPDAYAGQAGKMVVVNVAENAVEFVDQPDVVVIDSRPYTLTNAGFESNNLSSWTESTVATWATGSLFNAIAPSEGAYLSYYDYGQGTSDQSLTYDTIDLTDVATTTELDDPSAQLRITVGMASDNGDLGNISIEFFNGVPASLGVFTSSDFIGSGTMTDRTYTVDIPTGARSASIALNITAGTPLIDPASVAFAFDDLRVNFRMETVAPTTFLSLTDTPGSFSGQALKLVRVNSGATALEFATLSLVDQFTDLSDVPASFSGAGKKAVRVNSGATALEFVAQTAEIAPFWGSTTLANEILLSYTPTHDIRLPASLTGSTCKAEVAATASTTITLKKNGSSIGTIVFGVGGTTGTFTFSSNADFTANTDKLTIHAPATPDGTLADISLSLLATLL
jgi:hypothetical protein